VSIYRSTEGREAIRAWATGRLDRFELPSDRAVHPSSLGPSHVMTAGSGPDVVLVPGTNFCGAAGLPLIAALARTYRVHAIDLPGQPGLSHDERPGRDRSAYGRWLTELLPKLTGRPAVLVGHSLGARIVLSAVAEGADVRGLLLVDPAGLMRLSVTWTVMRPTLPWLRRPDAATSAGLLAMMMASGSRPTEDLTDWMTLVGRHVRTSMAPAPLPAAVVRRALTTPTVVVSGEHDAFLPPDRLARAVARRLPGTRVYRASGAGHLLPDERPDVVVELAGQLAGLEA
jgi:pimeloyl-ACP methyl ester carboxylesterase